MTEENDKKLYEAPDGTIRVREWSDGWPRYEIQLGHSVLLTTPDRALANALARAFDQFVEPGMGDETNVRCVVDGLVSLSGMARLTGELLHRASEREQAKALLELGEGTRDHHARIAAELRQAAQNLGYRESF